MLQRQRRVAELLEGQELADQFEAAATALDRSCDTVDDCMMAGGQVEFWSCDCSPTLPTIGVNAAAYSGSQAAALRIEWESRGCDEPAVCDKAPPNLTCNENHRCALDNPSCFDTPVDAGP